MTTTTTATTSTTTTATIPIATGTTTVDATFIILCYEKKLVQKSVSLFLIIVHIFVLLLR